MVLGLELEAQMTNRDPHNINAHIGAVRHETLN